jgi:outer membrane biosynthesis protein TonB
MTVQQAYDPLLDEESPSKTSVWLKRIVIALLVLVILGGIGYGFKKLLSGGDSHAKKKMTTIALKDLPPPPPPPPPKEQPKDQPKEQPKEVKVEPQPKPAETPPAEVLKMEGAAGDGPSPFAAGAVSGDYKGGETSTIGGGANKHQFDWYTGQLKEKIEDAISKDKELATGSYKVIVKVWVASSGRIQKYELVSSTGDPEKDALVRKALDGMPALSEPPPGDMPQPVKLKVSARSIG